MKHLIQNSDEVGQYQDLQQQNRVLISILDISTSRIDTFSIHKNIRQSCERINIWSKFNCFFFIFSCLQGSDSHPTLTSERVRAMPFAKLTYPEKFRGFIPDLELKFGKSIWKLKLSMRERQIMWKKVRQLFLSRNNGMPFWMN